MPLVAAMTLRVGQRKQCSLLVGCPAVWADTLDNIRRLRRYSVLEHTVSAVNCASLFISAAVCPHD